MKLDNFSKILIATGQINYMAASIDGVNQQIKTIPDPENIHSAGIKEKDEVLSDTVDGLAAILENLGDLINGHDCICHIDTRVARVPFEILLHGQDDTETDYDGEELGPDEFEQ
jgi:hypothetical protein